MAQIIPSTIKIGDRFHRPGKPNLVYRVLAMAAFYNHPPHVRLVSENPDQRTITSANCLIIHGSRGLPLQSSRKSHMTRL